MFENIWRKKRKDSMNTHSHISQKDFFLNTSLYISSNMHVNTHAKKNSSKRRMWYLKANGLVSLPCLPMKFKKPQKWVQIKRHRNSNFIEKVHQISSPKKWWAQRHYCTFMTWERNQKWGKEKKGATWGDIERYNRMQLYENLYRRG